MSTEYLRPVRIAFRKCFPQPGRMSFGNPEKALGHIYVRWMPAERIAKVSMWSSDENSYVQDEFASPSAAGAEAVRLTESVIEAYRRHQQQAIDQHLQDFKQFDPNQRIRAASGFRPITIRAAHADFVDRTMKEAAALRQSVYDGAQALRLRGWVDTINIQLPEFVIPNPWK